MPRLFAPVLSSLLLTLGGCASTLAQPLVAPDYSAVATSSASPRANLYADCIAQATTTESLAEAHDDDSDLILFRCQGAPARAFYDGLAARSAAIGSQFDFQGRTYRSTNAVIANLYGVDYCSTGGPDDYACVITLNAGPFLSDDD